jgi:hypothetical protein
MCFRSIYGHDDNFILSLLLLLLLLLLLCVLGIATVMTILSFHSLIFFLFLTCVVKRKGSRVILSIESYKPHTL